MTGTSKTLAGPLSSCPFPLLLEVAVVAEGFAAEAEELDFEGLASELLPADFEPVPDVDVDDDAVLPPPSFAAID
ncbi:MAG: hypothetical protein WCP55_13635, partial [Lentisphaerota bacterium]